MAAYENQTSASSNPRIGETVAADETDRLIASDKVEGTRVYNRKGDHLGKVENLMIDKFSGQVAYAVVSFGGFLGMGERYYPLPWRLLDYEVSQGGFVVDLDKEKIKNAPSHTADEAPWGNPEYGRGVYGYYGIPWYI